LVAGPGSKHYSRLSVGVYYKAISEYLETISKDCFSPKPKVDSAIIRMIPRKEPPFKINNVNFFYELIRNLFNHKRKKIKTTIKEMYNVPAVKIPYNDNRVEELTPEQIGNLSNTLYKLLNE
jgi:16S rRNA (adenine1518-N6/adenine1519-N6)-dimethyltransferase